MGSKKMQLTEADVQIAKEWLTYVSRAKERGCAQEFIDKSAMSLLERNERFLSQDARMLFEDAMVDACGRMERGYPEKCITNICEFVVAEAEK